MPQQPGRHTRISAIDGLRGLAACAVMLAHFSAPPVFPPTFKFTPLMASWSTYGQFGVEVFFMISGFVIALSLKGKSLWTFLVTRFIRLYPIFWVCIGVSCLARGLLLPDQQTFSMARILANATMIPNQFLGINSYIEGSYWTLEMELYFYAACGFCWFAFRHNPIIGVLAGISLLNVVIDLTGAITRLADCPRLLQSLAMRSYGWLFVQYAHLFLIGVASSMRGRLGNARYLAILAYATAVGVYHNRFSKIDDTTNAIMVLAMEMLFLATISIPGPLSATPKSAHWIASLGAVPLAFVQRSLGNPLMLFLGRVSYPLYLIHQGIGAAVIGRVRESGLPAYSGILTASCLTIAAAALLTIYVDEPLRRWLSRRLLLPASGAGTVA